MNWLDPVPPRPRDAVGLRSAGLPEPGASIGLVAGLGRFPVQLAMALTARGWRVVVLGLDREVDRALTWQVAAFHPVDPWKLGRLVRLLREEGCADVVLAGKVHRTALWSRFLLLRHRPDLTFLRLWLRHLVDRRDGTILQAFAALLGEEGLRLRSAAELCPELMAPRGLIGLRQPTTRELGDAFSAWSVARELSRLDVGQAVVVRDRVIVALEAVEGTDATIRRASQFSPGGGFGLVKVARPGQDMRLDAPVVGPRTIRILADGGGTFVAVEAERTLLVEAEDALALADARGIAVFGLTDADVAAGRLV